MTEEDYLDADGNIQRGRKASPVAAKWAQNMTDHFSDLAQHDSAFGQLRNVMDLAVVGSLIHRQGLLQSSELAIPYLLSEARLASYPIPRSTSSKASFVKKGGDWVISASGGVQILPWEWVDQVEVSTNADGVRQQFAAAPSSFWAH